MADNASGRTLGQARSRLRVSDIGVVQMDSFSLSVLCTLSTFYNVWRVNPGNEVTVYSRSSEIRS